MKEKEIVVLEDTTHELVDLRKEQINKLTQYLYDNANGTTIVGNGKELVHHELVPLTHSFVDGVYIRELKMNKGILAVGAIHKHLHVWFLLEGDLTIATHDTIKNYVAPCYVISKPGTQRVLYANEDSIFVNIHKNPNEIRDIRELEKEWSALTQEEYDEYIKNK